MKFFLKSLMVAGLMIFGAAANAATWTVNSTVCSTTDINPEADDCFGFTDGNLQGANGPDLNNDTFGTDEGLFGMTGWNTIQVDTDFQGGQTGMFDIVANTYDTIVVMLKGSNEWAAYLIEGGFSGTLSFDMGNDRGLSNYIVAGRMSDIPLPAAGFLLLGGLAGLGLMGRRKKA